MRRILALTAGLLGGAIPALTQPSPTPFHETLTVTATAEEEPASQVPVAVDVVAAEEIERRQSGFALDLLRTLPGLDVARAGSPGKVASLFSRGTNSSHTLLLWNGVALNDPYLGGFDLSTLATDGVARLEVVRGPYSALYGSSALGGVVQVLTGHPERGVRTRLEGGSKELRRAGAAAGGTLGAVRLGASGHLRRGEGELVNDFYDADELALSLAADLNPGLTLGARLRRLESELGVPRGYFGPTPRQLQTLDATTLALPVGWTDGALELDAQLGGTATRLEIEDADDPFAASRADARREQARLVARRALPGGMTLSLGGDWQRDRVESGSAFGAALAGERQRIWALFAQGSLARGPLRLDLGVRRDESDAFGGETSLRVAAAWRLGERFRLRAGYGEAFRAPSLADLYYPGFSNPELLPERGESLELAVEGELGPLRLALAGFDNRMEQLIEFDFVSLRPVNLGRARARGLEASLALATARLDMRLAATLQEAQERPSGRRLLRRPEESASLVVSYRPGAWTVGGVVRFVGERVDFGEIPLASHTTLDLTAAWRVAEWIEPFARIENAADARYEELAGYPAPRRGFAAGCALRF